MINTKKDLSDLTISATDARNNWSSVVDSVIREKPKLIKRTRDCMFLGDLNILKSMLEPYKFTARKYVEDNGSITLGLEEIEFLAENGIDEQDAIKKLAKAILEFSEDFYKEFSYWSSGNGKKHIPYIFKALILNDVEKIGGLITCRPGEI